MLESQDVNHLKTKDIEKVLESQDVNHLKTKDIEKVLGSQDVNHLKTKGKIIKLYKFSFGFN